MLCYQCVRIIDVLLRNNIDLCELGLSSVRYGDKARCSSCKRDLSPGDYVVSDGDVESITEAALDLLASHISKVEIEFCSACKGADLEHAADTWNKNLESGDREMSPGGSDLHDVLSQYELDEFENDVLYKLRCSNCGYGAPWHPKHAPDTHSFELLDRAYTRRDIDAFWGDEAERISKIGVQYGIVVSEDEVNELVSLISRTPLLAMMSPAGKKIYDILQAHFLQEEAELLPRGSMVFRGRLRHPDDPICSTDQMWEPPSDSAVHGRYNGVGFPVLYCCDQADCIPFELNPGQKTAVDIATLSVRRDMKLFAVDSIFSDSFSGFVSSPNRSGSVIKMAYLFTNFIGECCKDIGYQGISYKPLGRNDYRNYAFFNYTRNLDLHVEGVQRLEYRASYEVVLRAKEEF